MASRSAIALSFAGVVLVAVAAATLAGTVGAIGGLAPVSGPLLALAGVLVTIPGAVLALDDLVGLGFDATQRALYTLGGALASLGGLAALAGGAGYVSLPSLLVTLPLVAGLVVATGATLWGSFRAMRRGLDSAIPAHENGEAAMEGAAGVVSADGLDGGERLDDPGGAVEGAADRREENGSR